MVCSGVKLEEVRRLIVGGSELGEEAVGSSSSDGLRIRVRLAMAYDKNGLTTSRCADAIVEFRQQL